MPLASSLSASKKRAAVVKAEQERQERLERISLPRSIRGSTRVTKESVKRRRKSRAQSKERMAKHAKAQQPEAIEEDDNTTMTDIESTKENNQSSVVNSPPPKDSSKAEEVPAPILSPTPYWKVAQERRKSKAFSPPITRSSSKKKKAKRDDDNDDGIVLAFSPPDHEENARREQEEAQAKMRNRDQRVIEAINEKRLLIYSPNSFTCRNFNLDDSNDAAEATADDNNSTNDDQGDEGEDGNKKNTSPVKEDNTEEQPPFESLSHHSSGGNSSGSRMSDMTSSRLQSDFEIRDDIKEIKEKLDLVVNDRRNSDAGIFQHQQDRMALETERTKTEELQTAKSKLEVVVSDLQTERAKEREEFMAEQSRLSVELEVSQKEFSQKVEALESEVASLKEDKAKLSKQVSALEEDLKATKIMLSTNEADTKAIEELLAKIETKEHECVNMKEELTRMKDIQSRLESEIKRTEQELNAYKTKLEDSDSQLNTALQKNKDQERETQKEIQARETTINDLVQRINGLREDKVDTSDELNSMKEALTKIQTAKDAQDKQISELKEALENAQQKHKQTRESFTREKTAVESSLENLKSALVQSAENLRICQDSEAAKAQEARQKNARIVELERQLLETNSKLESAVVRLSTSDEREEELLRKLSKGEAIRSALHNRVMQLSGHIKVYVRVRPLIPGEQEKLAATAMEKSRCKRNNKATADMESPFSFPGQLDTPWTSSTSSSCQESDDLTKRMIEITEPARDRGGLSERRKVWRFPFDNVFSPNSNQKDVWEAVDPLVQSAIDGFPTCIFAYGQTGSGKTYTMLGEPGNEGIIARSVNKMFAAKRELEENSRHSTKVQMSIELLEIYNEQVRDLLASDSGPNGREISLKVTSNEVVGNILLPASSEQEVMDVLALAQSRRCVKATQSNAESSRSHMVFTLHFNVAMKNGIKREGKLNICDLAGSERLSKSGANSVVKGDLMKETKCINSSLSVLSNVIEKLQAGSSSIPYRESKLTFLLQHSLGGNSKTLAIVCCNPHAAHFHESLCSIRFAEKVNKVELKAMANFSC